MIRHSLTSDRSALLKIWHVCFGDSESYINFFLDNGYDPDHCLVWVESGLPVAMLHLRMADYIADGKAEPTMYIYAAATLPEFQGRGIMARLIDAAVTYGNSQGYFFTFLLPAGDRLYDYYSRLGFKTVFEVKKARLNRRVLSELAKSHTAMHSTVTPLTVATRDVTPPIKTPFNAAQYETDTDSANIFNRRLTFFNPAVQWHEMELAYVLSEWQFTGGEVLHFDDGYALCRKYVGGVEIKEVCGNFATLSAALLSRYDCDTFDFMLPPYTDFPFETDSTRYGMLISANSDTIEYVKSARPYINLMLD